MVRAVAIGRTAEGQILVETRFGQLAQDLDINPVRGTVLQLQISRAGVPTELTLIDANTGRDRLVAGAPNAQAPTAVIRVGDIVQIRPVPADGEGSRAPTILARIIILSSAKPNAATLAQGAVSGRILSSSPTGPTIIQTGTGTMLLPTVGNLKPGMHLVFEPAGNPTVSPAPVSAPPSLTTLGGAWTALQDTHAVLAAPEINPAGIPATTAIPATGPNLTTGMVFLLNALLHGNFQEWLGRDVLRTLEGSEKSSLLGRLSDDFGKLSRIAAEPVNGEWRVAMLPLLHDRMLEQIRFYLRQDDPDTSDEVDPPGTRFVVEVSLSQLGAIQLDGLVRPGRFDLIVRSHTNLPPIIQSDVSALFDAANSEFSAVGQIGFQVQNPFAVAPLDDVEEPAAGVFA
tara:strand:+ start:23937 stop:25136 length:1200 start_codon:yes stop_codon:yes gene_type:complete